MSEEKNIKTLCVRIEEDIYNELRRVAFRKFKRFHGAIALAVREALEEYIRKHWTPETPLTQITQA